MNVTVTSLSSARRGVGTFDFFNIDFVGETGFVRCFLGVKLRFRFSGTSSAFLLLLTGDVVNREPRAGRRSAFSLLSFLCCCSAGCGRMGEDSGEPTKTLRNARYAKMWAGVGAASIRVSSISYYTIEDM